MCVLLIKPSSRKDIFEYMYHGLTVCMLGLVWLHLGWIWFWMRWWDDRGYVWLKGRRCLYFVFDW